MYVGLRFVQILSTICIKLLDLSAGLADTGHARWKCIVGGGGGSQT